MTNKIIALITTLVSASTQAVDPITAIKHMLIIEKLICRDKVQECIDTKNYAAECEKVLCNCKELAKDYIAEVKIEAYAKELSANKQVEIQSTESEA